MSAFATANAVFVCLELVSMIAGTLLFSKGGLPAIVPGMFAFLIILNLHNVTTRHISALKAAAGGGQ